jgi:D-alanyl-D-alanine carboxypeptidase
MTIHNNNYAIISTGTPTYWPTDKNKMPDLLDFFITNGISTNYISETASFNLTSNHSPIIATISTSVMLRKPKFRLHNSKTNWDLFKKLIELNIKLNTKLKEPADIENECKNFIILLQDAAKTATTSNTQINPTNNIPLRIKKLIAEKRRASSSWQRTHTLESRTKYNQLSKKLKSQLHELKNESFENYITSLT